MQFLSNMRISHKISALMIGLIVGFIVIGITYYVQINLEKGSRTLERTAIEMQAGMLRVARIESDLNAAARLYVVTGQSQYAERAQELQVTINSALENLRQSATLSPKIDQDLANLQTEMNDYGALVEEVTTSVAALDNQGLQKQLASLETELNNTLQQRNLPDLSTQFASIAAIDTASRAEFDNQIANLIAGIAAADVTPALERNLVNSVERYQQISAQIASEQQKMTALGEQLTAIETAIDDRLTTVLADVQATANAIQVAGTESKQVSDAIVTAIIFIVAIGTAVGIYLIYKSIVFPMVHIQSVIRKINRGKTQARVKVMSHDELGDLGLAFNKLLDERIQQLEDQSKDNDKLNNSIIALIRALGLIAQKNLSIKVPVSADITGTISDAVNLLTTETAKTLQQVRTISNEVNSVSTQLEEQSDVVMKFAENERRQIIATSRALEVLANAMNDVAKRSEAANEEAERAITSTRSARGTVLETVAGIRTIRETISETEKRVKRLGERSQEVSGIVNLINTIAERTHILALNASMHAASAGEAGKGFAVVADEVQRLAENARQSTDEISAMVNSMRVDTSDTVTIMNTLISQVVEGTRLAEEAGKRMEDTETATKDLVENVKIIAQHATQQAEIATRVKDRAAIIRTISEKTGKQLEQQREQTQGLKHCAANLVERVNVFVLPESEEQETGADWSNVRKLPTAADAS